MLCNYILDANGNAVPEPDFMKWAVWFETALRTGTNVVARTPVLGVVVSTVFLGIDHNFRRTGPPVLWETMICREALEGERSGSWWDYQERYTSRAQAIAGHTRAIDYVLAQKVIKT